MIVELWNAFPRLLVQKINALLDEAEPRPMKAFHLYKTCQREGLWQEGFEKFSKQLQTFFALPRFERRKSHLDALLERPMAVDVYSDFQLNFHNALVNNKTLLDIASWAHHLIRVGYKTESLVISEDVLTKTLNYITDPPPHEKDHDIEFEDFCSAWKTIVVRLFGKKYDDELNAILRELQWLNAQLLEVGNTPQDNGFFPTIYLTQTEIDWVSAVKKATLENEMIPKFPLSRGPQKRRLIDLERVVNLYKVVQRTKLPELLKHRENIRNTILDRCESLLREKAS